jgi:hypothetical protein
MLDTHDKTSWEYPSMCRVGDRVGRYTLLEKIGTRPYGATGQTRVIWRVRCDCGTEKLLSTNNFQKMRRKHGGCHKCCRSGPKPGTTGKLQLPMGRRIADAAERLDMSKSAMYNRIYSGWTVEEATTTPVGQMPARFLRDPARRRGLAMAKKVLAMRQAKTWVQKNIAPEQLRPSQPSVFQMFQECGGVL